METLSSKYLDFDEVDEIEEQEFFYRETDLKNAIAKMKENLKKYNFKDDLGHPLENCVEIDEIFGDRLFVNVGTDVAGSEE